jgi:hypothetical protein
MLVGLAVAVVGGWVGSLIPAMCAQQPARVMGVALLIGLISRFIVTLALAVGLKLSGLVPTTPLLIWVGAGHLLVLATDSLGLVRLVRITQPTGATA